MENKFNGVKDYINRLNTLNDASIYIGVTPETDQRQDDIVNGVAVSMISRKVFHQEPIMSNATLLLKNITGGDSFEYDLFGAIEIGGSSYYDSLTRKERNFGGGTIAKRDFVTPIFESNKDFISKNLFDVVKLKSQNNSNYKNIMETISNTLSSLVREYAKTGSFEANPSSYMKLKGYQRPLQLSGQMIEAITGEVIER